jgi:hypothetical protein
MPSAKHVLMNAQPEGGAVKLNQSVLSSVPSHQALMQSLSGSLPGRLIGVDSFTSSVANELSGSVGAS